MRDGVELLTDIYAPVAKSLGTLLIRTPYGRTGLIALLTARSYATHGYHVVNQSCRGTFGSGGDFQPFRPDIDDGADTVAWLRRQAWFGGRFALCGASYLGFTAWALMTDPPPELVAAVIAISAHDNQRRTRRTAARVSPDADIGALRHRKPGISS
jgi:putative CocE/NonD family hydrolase